MAKSKGKAHASSVVPPKVEETAGNDAIAESAEAEKSATGGVLEVDKVEETYDVLDKSEGEDKEEKITDDLDESEEGEEVNEEGDEGNEEVEEEEVVEEEVEDEEIEEQNEEQNEKADEKEDQQETKENGKVESIAIDVVPQGAKVEGDNIKEDNGSGKGENVPTKKAKKMRKSKKEAVGDVNKQSDAGTSAVKKKKDVKKLESMGLIFMCNKKTKKDCFQYNIFGLPESKKELVAKVYKGMRLFLFDVDLKLMYGIYKAASPGGYNIEPKAFKSAYPSQVRFSVLNDFLPLPEEKFKSAIKENYYGKNKFDCQLSTEQVNNLCKLFRNTTKLSKKMMSKDVKKAEVKRAEPEPTSSARAQKRSRHDEPVFYSRDRKRSHRDEPPASSSVRDRKRSHRRERERRERIVPRGRDLYPPRRREVYDSPPPRPLPCPPPSLSYSYSYDRPVEDYYYRRDPRPLEPRDRRVMDLERRPVEPRPLERGPLEQRSLELRPLELRPLEPRPLEYRDPYSLYRDPLPYREPLYPPSSVYAPPPPAAASSLPSSYAPSRLYYRY